jgi:hypothetical protein
MAGKALQCILSTNNLDKKYEEIIEATVTMLTMLTPSISESWIPVFKLLCKKAPSRLL